MTLNFPGDNAIGASIRWYLSEAAACMLRLLFARCARTSSMSIVALTTSTSFRENCEPCAMILPFSAIIAHPS